MDPRWRLGVWLGSRFGSNEHIIGLESGEVVKARNIQAREEEHSWSIEAINWVKGTPSNPLARPPHQDGPQPPIPAEVVHDPNLEGQRDEAMRNAMPRSTYIMRKHLEKYGFSRGCAKCRSIMVDEHVFKAGAECIHHSVLCFLRDTAPASAAHFI